MKYKSFVFFSLWASPRQEYGNIKKTTTYRYFDKFFRCRAICSQNWRGISLTHESWERSGPRRSLKSSMPMYKRRWMIGSLVWHVWWHQAIQMGRCLCCLLRTQRVLASSSIPSNMPGGFQEVRKSSPWIRIPPEVISAQPLITCCRFCPWIQWNVQ